MRGKWLTKDRFLPENYDPINFFFPEDAPLNPTPIFWEEGEYLHPIRLDYELRQFPCFTPKQSKLQQLASEKRFIEGLLKAEKDPIIHSVLNNCA